MEDQAGLEAVGMGHCMEEIAGRANGESDGGQGGKCQGKVLSEVVGTMGDSWW